MIKEKSAFITFGNQKLTWQYATSRQNFWEQIGTDAHAVLHICYEMSPVTVFNLK